MNQVVENSANTNSTGGAIDNSVMEKCPMLNMPVIKSLVYKDIYLNRKLIATYIGGAIFALSIISLGEWQFFMGSIVLISMMIGLGNHQLSTSMISERKEQTLVFIMSQPVSPADYAMAKFLSNIAMFFVPWSFLFLTTIGVLILTPLPDGLLPFTVLICVLILLNHCITWSIAMEVESEGIILTIMIGLNCLFNPALYFLADSPDIGGHTRGADIVWNATSINVLILEVVAIVLLFIATLYFQMRKKVFI